GGRDDIGSYFCVFCFFFFQAEDGIRDRNVTGVQTCALPICGRGSSGRRSGASLLGAVLRGVDPRGVPPELACSPVPDDRRRLGRSEERRVGKECRSRWSP